MTPDEINATIANHLGWTNLHIRQLERDHPNDRHMMPHGCRPGGSWNEQEVPEFDEDLNAMHKAKKSLSGDPRIEFINVLCGIVRTKDDGPYTAMTKAFYAEAAHEAEAFVRVIGKWVD